MGELRYPRWQQTYHDALLELNPQKLVQRVSQAETAVLSRLQEIRFRSDSCLGGTSHRRRDQWLACSENETVIFKSSQIASDNHNTIGPESDQHPNNFRT